jgi:hypothetical protein
MIDYLNLNVGDLIRHLDRIEAFKTYRNVYAKYDDAFYEQIPISLLITHDLDIDKLGIIQSNTDPYEGSIIIFRDMIDIIGGL